MTLLSLPVELRIKIYKFVLPEYMAFGYRHLAKISQWRKLLCLTAVNKQIRSEYLPLIHRLGEPHVFLYDYLEDENAQKGTTPRILLDEASGQKLDIEEPDRETQPHTCDKIDGHAFQNCYRKHRCLSGLDTDSLSKFHRLTVFIILGPHFNTMKQYNAVRDELNYLSASLDAYRDDEKSSVKLRLIFRCHILKSELEGKLVARIFRSQEFAHLAETLVWLFQAMPGVDVSHSAPLSDAGARFEYYDDRDDCEDPEAMLFWLRQGDDYDREDYGCIVWAQSE